MTEVTVKLSSDTVTDIVAQELTSALEGLIRDAQARATDRGFAIFDHDATADLAEINRHCAALNLILEYYTGTSSNS